jgi:membrane protein YqaA with SNARE-associated domain
MELTRLLGYCGGSFAIGFVSGLVPAVNTEAYLLAVAALAPSGAVAPVVVFVTAGQMLAKALLYLAGSGALHSRFLAAHEQRLASVRRRIERMRSGASALLFSSALIGIPPFYFVSVAAGSLRWSLARFLLVGGSGRLLRFAAIVALPGLLGAAR